MEKKRIAVVTIGGTMFMQLKRALRPGEVTLPPLRESKDPMPQGFSGKPIRPDEVIIEHNPLFNIDSSQIRRYHLNKLGEEIAKLSNDDGIDGIIVISGTDRMHRIVTRLAHHVHDLHKPVVFTGAQVPISVDGSDARRNYEHAVRAAIDLATMRLNNFFLVFGGSRQKGGEIQHPLNMLKASATSLDAFDHPYKRVVGHVTWSGGVKTSKLGKQMAVRSGLKRVRQAVQLAKRAAKTGRPTESVVHIARAWRHGMTTSRQTAFTPIRKDLIDVIEISETKTISEIKLNPRAKVIILRASGKGNPIEKVMRQVNRLAAGRPVIVTTEAGADVDLTAYGPGQEALRKGMLPCGGLITQSAEIRAEYLAHHMDKISDYAKNKKTKEMSVNEFKRRLFAALYLSGAKFRGGSEVRKKHENSLGTKILGYDVVTNQPIEEALAKAHLAIVSFTRRKQLTLSYPKKKKKQGPSPQNLLDPDRKEKYLTTRPFPPFREPEK